MKNIENINSDPDLFIFLKSPFSNKQGQFELNFDGNIWIESRAQFCDRLSEILREDGKELWRESNLSSLLYDKLGLWDWEQLDLDIDEHANFQKDYGYLVNMDLGSPIYLELGSRYTFVNQYADAFDAAIKNVSNVLAFHDIYQLLSFARENDDSDIKKQIEDFLKAQGYVEPKFYVVTILPDSKNEVCEWSSGDLKRSIEENLNEPIGVVICLRDLLLNNFGIRYKTIDDLVGSPFEFAYSECLNLLGQVDGDMLAPLYQEPMFPIKSRPVFLHETTRFEYYLNKIAEKIRPGETIKVFSSKNELEDFLKL